jgi:hypothetical protein
VIRLVPSESLSPSDRYAVEVLVDLSRVVPAEGDAMDVARVRIVADSSSAGDAELADGDIGIRAGDGEVVVPTSALRLVTDVAGAGVEQRSDARDRFGRVPSGANPLVARRLERRAVLSRAARRFREAAVAAAGRRPFLAAAPWPEGRRWAAAFTHDLDAVAAWPVFTALRVVELLRKGETALAARTLGAAARSVASRPLLDAALDVLRREAACGVRSSWFLLCGTPTWTTMRAGDITYRAESRDARRIVERAAAQECEIGLHGSFETSERKGAFSEQRARLAAIAGRPPAGVRQHYLRMRLGETQRWMAKAGFAYDSTSGFPDRNGFRLGVADVLPVWDDERAAALPLDTVPFAWMDRALSKYRGVERPDAWIDDALELAAECRHVEGLWVGIWHPNLAAPLGFPGAPAAFSRLLEEVTSASPFVAPLDALVRWRVARRGLRAYGIAADGRPDVRGANDTEWPLPLEDAGGRVVLDARTTG